jgi:hypothetical protein
MAEERRCAKHDPQPSGDGLGHVRCSKCGMEGLLSNGRPRAGRPQKIIWLRRLYVEAEPQSN